MLHLLGSILMGALVGFIAGNLMNAAGGFWRNVVIGIIGSFVGSFTFGLLGFYARGLVANLIVDVLGACLFIWLGRRLFR